MKLVKYTCLSLLLTMKMEDTGQKVADAGTFLCKQLTRCQSNFIMFQFYNKLPPPYKSGLSGSIKKNTRINGSDKIYCRNEDFFKSIF